MSFSDNGIEFKLYLNEEIQRIKQTLKQSLNKEEISKDSILKEKTHLVLKRVEKYGEKNIDTSMIKEILKIQSLIKEMNSEEVNTNG
jgi:transcriptional regulator NrdR family protein